MPVISSTNLLGTPSNPSISYEDFTKGLWIEGRPESNPDGTLRRNKGVDAQSTSSIRSRNGSTLNQSLNAHSLHEFNDNRFAGATSILYRDGSSVKEDLDGTKLTFAKMPSTTGKVDSLFVTGGGDLFKVDTSGNSTNWGIVAPTTNPSAATGSAGNLNGTYQYKVTFRNSTTAHRSNGNPTAASVSPSNEQVDLSSIPVSSDAQVDAREIWRTTAGGATFFLLTTINNNTATTYTDDAVDSSLSSTELPTDNDPPDDTYEDCVGPWEGRMWFGRNTASGSEGTIGYSPTDRAEAVAGTVVVSSSDDEARKLVIWNGTLYVLTPSKLIEVSGSGAEEIFNTRILDGVPGTTDPFTVVTTARGIIYETQDGIVLFNGSRADQINMAPVAGLWRGKTLGGISYTTGSHATVTEREYFITDGTVTLAYNLTSGIWRNVGVGCNALFYERESGELQASFSNKVLLLEDEGVLTDDGVAIEFEVELPHAKIALDQQAIIRRLFVEIDTSGETITPTLLLNDATTTLNPLVSTSQQTFQQNLLKVGNTIGIRLAGSISDSVEINRVHFDIYVPNNTSIGDFKLE